MLPALILFLAVYVFMIALPKWRWLVAAIGAATFVVSGILPLGEVLPAVNWNVLLMIAGTMGTVALFISSKMPARLADMIINKVPNEKWAIIALSVFAGIISAFVDNVATVLMVAPIAITISKKLGTSPIPSVIAISIASNLEGAATLVGDTTSIMLGGAMGMNFLDFFAYDGKMGLFFINQIGLLLATLTLLFVFRKNNKPLARQPLTQVQNYVPTILLVGTVLLLIVASLLPLNDFLPTWVVDNINGIICVSMFIIGIAIESISHKENNVALDAIKALDWQTIVLLASLFIVIAGINSAGMISWLADFIFYLGGNSVFGMYSIIVWASVLISAFIDNIPYVATMLPVVASLGSLMNVNPTVFYFGLLCGATLGGNLTPIGASANIAGIGMLRKEGFEVSNSQFMKISVPYTLVAVSSAYVLVWLVFGA
ncbi:MAG: arsenic transporter [Clostridiales bacterium]|nr:arsenic transporter [Clostridiales bacterium]